MSKMGELAFEKKQEENNFAMEEAEHEKEVSDEEERQKRMAEADEEKYELNKLYAQGEDL